MVSVVKQSSFEQKLFIYDIFAQHSSWRKCHRKYPDSTVLCKARLKKLCLLAIQFGLAKTTPHMGMKLLKSQPYKTTVLHRHLPPDYEARIQCCRWFQEAVFGGLPDLELIFYSDEAWFTLSDYVNSQSTILGPFFLMKQYAGRYMRLIVIFL